MFLLNITTRPVYCRICFLLLAPLSYHQALKFIFIAGISNLFAQKYHPNIIFKRGVSVLNEQYSGAVIFKPGKFSRCSEWGTTDFQSRVKWQVGEQGNADYIMLKVINNVRVITQQVKYIGKVMSGGQVCWKTRCLCHT